MKSIIDTVISEKTARLFDKENYTYPIEYYWIDGKLAEYDMIIEDDVKSPIYKAPSISMLLKFLRKERGIIITPSPLPNDNWMSEVYIQDCGKLILTGDIEFGKSWEEVVEKQIIKLYE